jgi:inward rectifier potassium channel
MLSSSMKKSSSPVSIRSGKIEFLRMNSRRQGWPDFYRTVLALTWPRFGLAVLLLYLGINLIFATAYFLGDACIAEMKPGSFTNAFFFSVQTLSTVGFGHLYPATLYGDVVTTLEIIVGMFFTAAITGLIFVRFSRPTARLIFSKTMVISNFGGRLCLQLRVANQHHQPMVEAQFRLMMIRREWVTEEEEDVRRFYSLKLDFDHLISFPSALIIRHQIDEQSPLYGVTPAKLKDWKAHFITSIVCIDTVIQASVQSKADYASADVYFDHQFVEIYTEHDDGRFEVDYGRIHDIEPVSSR